MDCEHKFGFKLRNISEYYCPVCRAVVDKTEIDGISKQGEAWWPDLSEEADEQC